MTSAHTADAALGEGERLVGPLFAAGHARGLQDCRATHREMRKAWRHEAQQERQRYSKMAHEYGFARGEARGRVTGALIVAVLVGLSWWWRTTR